MRKRIRSLVARRREEGGQMIVMTVLLLFLFIPLGAAVFDVGLLVNDRRQAQNLADKAALAGALELSLKTSEAANDAAAAEAAAEEWAIANGLDLDANGTEFEIVVDYGTACYNETTAYPTGVSVTTNRDAPSFLAGALGIDLRAGATALACAGRPNEMFGTLPFVLSKQGVLATCFTESNGEIVGQPGADCKIRVDAPEEGIVAELTVDWDDGEIVDCSDTGSGAADLNKNIQYGVQGWCEIGQEVTAKPGVNINKTYDGLLARLANEGGCDATSTASTGQLQEWWNALGAVLPPGNQLLATPEAGDGVDDFYQVWHFPESGHPAAGENGLQQRECDYDDDFSNSPRNVVLIVVDDAFETTGGPGKKYNIADFARVYIEGCTRHGNQGDTFDKTCQFQNGLQGGGLTIHARYVQQIETIGGSLGHQSTLGDLAIFLKR